MNKAFSKKGISNVFVILLLIIVVLLFVIIFPLLKQDANKDLLAMDKRLEETAIKQAAVLYLQDGGNTSMVFDAETKKFFDPKEARTKVKPYGNSEENQGKYILVTVDSQGNVSTKWTTPYGY